MNCSFNVLYDPWIPLMGTDGVCVERGILETLEHAHELRSISDASPMVEYSTFRFLIVFLMDALRPDELEDIEALLDVGHFDMDRVCAYVEQCISEGVSFDLFDDTRPFMQTEVSARWDKETKPVAALDYTVPSGNNHIHFDHLAKSESYSPAKSMRMLLSAQIFCTSAAQGYPSNVNGAPPWFTLINGKNLFETLVLNMVSIDETRVKFDDPPVIWRNSEIVESKKDVAQTSWLYGMLFPARRIHLIPDEDGRVSSIYLSQGMNYVNPSNWFDPHVIYNVNEKGRFNCKPTTEFAIWQNLASLISTRNECAPQVLSNYVRFHTGGVVDMTLYGVATNQSSYLQSSRSDLHLPVGIIGSETAEEFIRLYVSSAKSISKSVRLALAHREVPENSRREAIADFNSTSENLLFELLETLCGGADIRSLLLESEEKLLSKAYSCTAEKLGELVLRGRTMLETAELRLKELNKAAKAIRRKWENE